MPTDEQGLATVLIKWALPGVCEPELRQYLALRGSKVSQHTSVLTSENAATAEDIVAEDEHAELTKRVSKLAPADGVVDVGTDAGASSSSAHDARPELPVGLWTREQAAEKLPQVKGCSISVHTDRRWQVRYDLRYKKPKSFSRCWSLDGEPSHHDVLLMCLAWVWEVHRQENPKAPRCPWKLPPSPEQKTPAGK